MVKLDIIPALFLNFEVCFEVPPSQPSNLSIKFPTI